MQGRRLMNNLKAVGLTAIVAAALLAFAGSASATTITSPTGTTYTGTIKLEIEGGLKLHGAFTTIDCTNASIEEKIEKHGAGVTAGGNISSVIVSGCNFAVTVLKKGSMEIHAQTVGSEVNGTVTLSGSEITVATSIGSCIFTTSGTSIGTLTGSQATGSSSTLDIGSSVIPRTAGNFLCGSSGTLTGSFKTTTPSASWIDS